MLARQFFSIEKEEISTIYISAICNFLGTGRLRICNRLVESAAGRETAAARHGRWAAIGCQCSVRLNRDYLKRRMYVCSRHVTFPLFVIQPVLNTLTLMDGKYCFGYEFQANGWCLGARSVMKMHTLHFPHLFSPVSLARPPLPTYTSFSLADKGVSNTPPHRSPSEVHRHSLVVLLDKQQRLVCRADLARSLATRSSFACPDGIAVPSSIIACGDMNAFLFRIE
jgi:hypothetical protein